MLFSSKSGVQYNRPNGRVQKYSYIWGQEQAAGDCEVNVNLALPRYHCSHSDINLTEDGEMRTRNIRRLMMSGIVSSLFLASASVGQSARNQSCQPPSAQMLERSRQYLQNTPCAPVASACNKGGYILGCLVVKKGLVAECMGPLFDHKRVPGVEILPTDPDVAACRQFCGHDFGKGPCRGAKGAADR